ncbi:MAG: hypothetical protein JW990_07300 [Thermoleophilia bacterium]|nr:hypothetical protein [Thermoleophilia bacterium]
MDQRPSGTSTPHRVSFSLVLVADLLADIGNKAAHGDWSAYTDDDARAMLEGAEMIVGDLL